MFKSEFNDNNDWRFNWWTKIYLQILQTCDGNKRPLHFSANRLISLIFGANGDGSKWAFFSQMGQL